MLAHPELDWLSQRFLEYDLVYLDPLVGDLSLHRPWLSQWLVWRSEEKAIASFLGRLIETLGIRPEDASPSSFLGREGFGARFRSDRTLQRRVARVINEHLTEVKTRHHSDVASLQERKVSLCENIADRAEGGSLIVVDGMFATRAKAPEEIQRSIQAPVQYQDNSTRGIECMMADSPARLIALSDPVIGLMVSRRAFYYWTEAFTAILSAGWYPWSRAVGLYETIPGGHAFVNVIAILMRPYPSLDEVLVALPGEDSRCSLPGTLQHILENLLNPEIENLQAAKRKAGIADTGTRAATSLKPVYDRDKEFLVPVYLFQLCCQLNRVSSLGLQVRANRAYQVLLAYLDRLKVVATSLKDLGIVSQILYQETNVRELLPEPEEQRDRR